jgi:dolichol kinase
VNLGEAILVSSGLVLYCGDMLAHTLSKMEFSVSSEAFIRAPGTRNEIGTVIQVEAIALSGFSFLVHNTLPFFFFSAGGFAWSFSSPLVIQKLPSSFGLL